MAQHLDAELMAQALEVLASEQALAQTEVFIGDEGSSDAHSLVSDDDVGGDRMLDQWLASTDGQIADVADGQSDANEEEAEENEEEDSDGEDAGEGVAGEEDADEEEEGVGNEDAEVGVDTRRRRRTNAFGNVTRKDPDLTFKGKVRRKWNALSEGVNLTNSVKRRLMKQLRQFAADINPHFIIHNLPQVLRWDSHPARGTGSRKKKVRRVDRRRLVVLDDLLYAFVEGKRAVNGPVTTAELHAKANEYLRDEAIRQRCMNKTQVQIGYIRKFMKRRNLKVKRVKKRTPLTEAQIKEKAQDFHTVIFRCLPLVTGVINMDEVPMSLCGSMGNLRTVTLQSDTDVRVNFDAALFRRCSTLMVTGAVKKTGETFTPFQVNPILLFKGQPSQRRILEETYARGVDVVWTPKGVITSSAMRDKVIPLIRKACTEAGVEKCLFILDSASSHISPAVVQACFAANLPLAVVPGGCTSWLQWVDTHFAAQYRTKHKEVFTSWATTKMSASQKRRVLAKVVATSVPLCLNHVVRDFSSLGYLNASQAQIRGIDYRFEPPELSSEDREADHVRMEERIQEARSQGQAAATQNNAPSQPSRRPGRPSAASRIPVSGCTDIRIAFQRSQN